MNGLPYYKAYPRDFIEGTVGMDFEMKAAYRLVLDLIYMQGGKLPDEPRYIAGLLGCSVKKWNGLRERLISAGKIEVRDAYLGNLRADKELETLGKLQDQQRENRSRPNKNKALQSPPSNHTEPDTDTERKEEANASSKKPAARSRQVSDDFQPSSAGMDYAISKGMAAAEIPAQVAKFVAHHQSKGSKFKNVDKAWQTWCMNFAEFRGARASNVIPLAKPSAVDVRQYHPQAIDMGGGWWTTPGDEVEWYRDTNDCRPDKRTRDRMAAEEAEALRGAI